MIIFSVEQAALNRLNNNSNTLEASKRLGKGTYTILTGVYKGTEELSFITTNVDLGRELAIEFNQECYLERGHYGIWYLIDTQTGNILDYFKTIKEVPKDKALATDNYTMLDGRYYLASRY